MTRGFRLLQKRKYQEDPNPNPNPEGGDPNPNPAGDPNPNPEGNKPSDKEAELLKEVMKRKESEKALKTQLQQVQDQLKKFDGVDLAQVQALLQEKVTREREELEKRGEFDRVKQQIVEQHQAELGNVRTTLEGQVNELNAKLSQATSLITDLTIGRSFGDSAFVREALTLTPAKARVVYGSHFELQDGKVVSYDKPAGASDRTMLVDGKGEPLSFDQAIEKIVKADPDHEHLIKSKIKTGANSKNDPGSNPTQKLGNGRDRISAAIQGGALNLPK